LLASINKYQNTQGVLKKKEKRKEKQIPDHQKMKRWK